MDHGRIVYAKPLNRIMMELIKDNKHAHQTVGRQQMKIAELLSTESRQQMRIAELEEKVKELEEDVKESKEKAMEEADRAQKYLKQIRYFS